MGPMFFGLSRFNHFLFIDATDLEVRLVYITIEFNSESAHTPF